MSTVQFYFFQCRAASLLKIELQAYEIIVAGAFFWFAGEMRRLPACFDNPVVESLDVADQPYAL